MRARTALALLVLGACASENAVLPEPWPEPEPEPPVIARLPEVADPPVPPRGSPEAAPDDPEAALARMLTSPQHTVRVAYLPASRSFVVVDRVPMDGSTYLSVETVARGAPAKVLLHEVVGPRDAPLPRERVAAQLRAEKVGEALVLDALRVPMSPKPPREVEVGAIAGKVVWKGQFAEVARKSKPSSRLALPPGALDVDWVVASPDGALLLVSYLGAPDEVSHDPRTIRVVETVP